MRRSSSPAPALNTRRGILAALVFLGAISLAAPREASAQARAGEVAASQELGSDPDLAAWDIALTTDLLGPLFGSYSARVELAPVRWLSVAASPAWLTAADATGLALVVAAHLWPLGEGLDGPFVGPNFTAARVEVNGSASAVLGAGAEAGWQIVWRGLALALSADVGWAARTDGGASGVALALRAGLGWAWR